MQWTSGHGWHISPRHQKVTCEWGHETVIESRLLVVCHATNPIREGKKFEEITLEAPHNLNEVALCPELLSQTVKGLEGSGICIVRGTDV